MTTPHIPKAGDRFIMKSEIGNPFVAFSVEVLAVKNGWIQYHFTHVREPYRAPTSAKLDVFLDVYQQVPTEDAQGKL